MVKNRPLIWLALVLALPAPGFGESDPPPLERGEWVSVPGADSEFRAIFTPSTAPTSHGAVILIPDRRGHPDQPRIARPLRTGLPEAGWNTLAIPAPPADRPGGLLDIGTRRLQAAVDYLQGRDLEPIVLVGHGLGATLGAAYLATRVGAPAAGLATIGWYDPEGAQGEYAATEAIASITVPVFDLYGSRDLNAVQHGAGDRLQAARRAGRPYRQEVVEGADHDHTGLGPALTQRLRGWLHATIIEGESAQ